MQICCSHHSGQECIVLFANYLSTCFCKLDISAAICNLQQKQAPPRACFLTCSHLIRISAWMKMIYYIDQKIIPFRVISWTVNLGLILQLPGHSLKILYVWFTFQRCLFNWFGGTDFISSFLKKKF